MATADGSPSDSKRYRVESLSLHLFQDVLPYLRHRDAERVHIAAEYENSLGMNEELLIQATWLQLVELYDKLFGHVRDTLQEMPLDAIMAFQGPVGISGVPGMILMPGDLTITCDQASA